LEDKVNLILSLTGCDWIFWICNTLLICPKDNHSLEVSLGLGQVHLYCSP